MPYSQPRIESCLLCGLHGCASGGHVGGAARPRHPSVCRSACAAPKSPLRRLAICIRTAATTRCASSARVAGTRHSPSTRRCGSAAGLSEGRQARRWQREPAIQALHHDGKRSPVRRALHPAAIDRVLRKLAVDRGLGRGYSAHSIRASSITTALKNGAQLERLQKAAGLRDPSATKLYDWCGITPRRRRVFSPPTT